MRGDDVRFTRSILLAVVVRLFAYSIRVVGAAPMYESVRAKPYSSENGIMRMIHRTQSFVSIQTLASNELCRSKRAVTEGTASHPDVHLRNAIILRLSKGVGYLGHELYPCNHRVLVFSSSCGASAHDSTRSLPEGAMRQTFEDGGSCDATHVIKAASRGVAGKSAAVGPPRISVPEPHMTYDT